MKTDKIKTAVIFRTFKEGKDVIALFPFIPSDCNGWRCESYMHMGQHGGADPQLCQGWGDCTTRPSTPAETEPLERELRGRGYNLRVMKRFPRNAFAVRKAELERQGAA